MKYDILIIGAGAAGLMAMKELLEAGYDVCLAEAAAVAGGRIATIREKRFDQPVEAGAEFIHGDLPLTFKLLKEAKISAQAVTGKRAGVRNGVWNSGEEQEGHWEEWMKKLRLLKDDTTIQIFLDENFPAPKYNALRNAVQGFSEGFDLADIKKASILSVKSEWENLDETQYRIPGGYGQLVDYLLSRCLAMKGKIIFDYRAKKVEYSEMGVIVSTADKRRLEGSRLVLTASLGVLQSDHIQFRPELGAHADAIMQLGFGSVIKILLQFKTAFWRKKEKELAFLFTDEKFPTWWTQLPLEHNLLTGWLGGPKATEMGTKNEVEIMSAAIHSLSSAFHLGTDLLKEQLSNHKIYCWDKQPDILGGYSYCTPYTQQALEILSEPVADKIFFAGEAFHSGESQGTVEAALQSGLDVAKKIIMMVK